MEDLQRSFEELGVTCNDTVLRKCLEICKKYDITDTEDFVNSWMAYSLSKLHGENPNIANLHKFERDELAKKKKENLSSQSETQKRSLVIYEANNRDTDVEPDMDFRLMYDENASKGENVSVARTPESVRRPNKKASPQAVFSPASFSPTITALSSKYVSRKNSGEIVYRYCNQDFVSNVEHSYRFSLKFNKKNSVDIQRFMNFDLVDCLDYADDIIDTLGKELLQKFHLEDPMHIRYKSPFPFITFGKIACDSNGRLNSKSVLLEGSRELSSGEAVYLDLGGVDKYSLFPGQIVAVEGVNLTGDILMAKKIFCDASLEQSSASEVARGSLSIVVAAGPFTQSDSMTYQPLLDLVENVVSDGPDILILTGPFIDSNHPMIIENSLAETYYELFQKIVDLIMKPLQGKKTQVVILSSYKDCTANYIYPTPQFHVGGGKYGNLHLMPDPSIFSVAGVVFGVTSTDILMHIGKEEISSSGFSTDRLSRLAGHLISQRSFYPLMPSGGAPVDPLFIESAKLNEKPDILILPSDLRYFIKDVSGCIVINPERLAKGLIGGTFARLNITSSGTTGNIIRI